MTYHDKLKDQVEALAVLLECFMSLVEDMGQTLDEGNGAKKSASPLDNVTYIVSKRSGLIQKNEVVA